MQKIHYMRTILYLVAGIHLLLVSCSQENRTEPFKWISVGAEFDSLMTEVEWGYNNIINADSMNYLLNRLDSIAEHSAENRDVMKSRVHYWRGRILNYSGVMEEAKAEINEALRLNDSVNFYHDYLRIMMLSDKNDSIVNGVTAHKHNIESMLYGSKIGDNALICLAAVEFSRYYELAGEFDKAVRYLNTADSAMSILGFEKFVIKNKINHARIQGVRGYIEKSDSILLSIMNHPYVIEDNIAREVLLRNIFISTNDTSYLMTSYREIYDKPKFRNLFSLYNALLSIWVGQNVDNLTQSLKMQKYYSQKAIDYLPYVKDYNYRAYILNSRSDYYHRTQKYDSALIYRIAYEHAIDSLNIINNIYEVEKYSTMRSIDALEHQYKIRSLKRNVLIGGIAVLLLIGGIGIFIWYRTRVKLKELESELELNKANRKIVASVLSIEQKGKLLEELQRELSELREGGKIDDEQGRKLQSSIKSHIHEKESDETFLEMFDVVHPNFATRLRKLWPNISESYVRLAYYLLMGFDSNRIARLLNIEYKSVYQLRWILRKHLGITGKDSLEDTLRRLNEEP